MSTEYTYKTAVIRARVLGLDLLPRPDFDELIQTSFIAKNTNPTLFVLI